MRRAIVAACLVVAGGPALAGQTLSNGRLTVGLATSPELRSNDNDRVDAFSWINTAGVSTGNLVASATSPLTCGDPVEFFGQAIGESEDNAPPNLITGGDRALYTARTALSGDTHKTGNACGLSDGNVVSVYTLFTEPQAVNELKVVRVFGFTQPAPVFPSGLRPYVARVPAAIYGTELIPNLQGTITRTDVHTCGGSCAISDWNGTWIADDDGHGNGLAIIRSVQSTAPAIVVIDTDDYSGSNASSIELLQPAGGFGARIREVDYLCAYDVASWPPAARAAGKLPEGCKLR